MSDNVGSFANGIVDIVDASLTDILEFEMSILSEVQENKNTNIKTIE